MLISKSAFRAVSLSLVLACSVHQAFGQRSASAPVLSDGTRVSLRLMQTLTSATAHSGDPVSFEVAEDVLVDGYVAIKQGTSVRGVVVEAVPKRRMGRAGKLTYAVTETKSADRQTIRLRASQQKKSGDSNVTGVAVTTTAVAVFVPVAAPFFLLRKGNDITVAQGTRVEAFVDGEHALQVAAAAALPPPSATASVLTNDDVVALRRAGFGDQVIIAKIKTSTTAFKLSPTDLVELKAAGVSEGVMTAMLENSAARASPDVAQPRPAETITPPTNPLVGQYSTNLPNTTAAISEQGDSLTLSLDGGDLSGVRVSLRRDGDSLSGVSPIPPCGGEARWVLRVIDRRLHGSFDRPSCAGGARAMRVGVLFEPVR